jgi:hypothetical protein
MLRLRLHLVPFLVLFVTLVACNGLSMKEAGYRNNVKDYNELVEKAKPPLKANVEAKRAAYQEAYGKLPSAEAERIKALDALNKAADKEIKELEAQVETANKANAAKDKAAMDEYRAKFVGTWEGDGMRLRIEPGGRVEYERSSGAVNTRLNGASVSEFRRDAFDVSLMGMKTTFKIDKAPTEENGKWTMTVDGARLEKVGG